MLRVVVVLAWLAPGFAFAQADARTRRRRRITCTRWARAARRARFPPQAGQSAFAAIQEIVQILEADPKTDWSKVDIEALRRHLIDMNNVTLYADVRSEPVEGGMRFTVTGAGAGQGLDPRAWSAPHAATMNGVDGWRFAAGRDRRRRRLTVAVFRPRTRPSCAASASSA